MKDTAQVRFRYWRDLKRLERGRVCILAVPQQRDFIIWYMKLLTIPSMKRLRVTVTTLR